MPTRENSPIDFLPERIAMRFLPDRFTLTLIATVLLASFLPARG
ncbi:TPA: bile acid:sodium symporter, partial [Serratia marcescens]